MIIDLVAESISKDNSNPIDTGSVDIAALETAVNALDQAVVLKGSWDASSGSFPGAGSAQAGDSYIVSVAGTVDSVAFTAGDRIIAIIDDASTSTYASNWLKADYSDLVQSVAGRTGNVTLTADDISDGSTNAIPTLTQESNWDTAYGWGDHSGLYDPAGTAAALTYSDVGAIQDSADTVTDAHIDWGTGANQVSADDIPDGATNAIITLTQETNFESAYTHSGLTSGNPHSVTATDLSLGTTDDVTFQTEILNGSTSAYGLTVNQLAASTKGAVGINTASDSPRAIDMIVGGDGNGATVYIEDTVTTNSGANAWLLYHDTSARTADVMYLDMASGSGSFTGNYLNFLKNSVPQFVVDANGQITTGSIGTSVTQTEWDAAYTHSTGDGSDHQDVADLATLSGVAANSTDLGTFTGTTIADSQTIKAAIQSLETALEAITGLSADAVNDTHIDWGTGANQVSADDIPDGSTNAIITLTQETNFETAYTHVSNTSNPHSVGQADVTEADVTGNRPGSPVTGQMFFDTTLGQPVWYDGAGWVDATGTTA